MSGVGWGTVQAVHHCHSTLCSGLLYTALYYYSTLCYTGLHCMTLYCSLGIHLFTACLHRTTSLLITSHTHVLMFLLIYLLMRPITHTYSSHYPTSNITGQSPPALVCSRTVLPSRTAAGQAERLKLEEEKTAAAESARALEANAAAAQARVGILKTQLEEKDEEAKGLKERVRDLKRDVGFKDEQTAKRDTIIRQLTDDQGRLKGRVVGLEEEAKAGKLMHKVHYPPHRGSLRLSYCFRVI